MHSWGAAVILGADIYNSNNNKGHRTLLRSQLIGSLLAVQANLILLAVHLLRHMLATHVNPHGLVIACTCLSALQSAASASYPKLATRQTAAQWGANTHLSNNTTTNRAH